MNSGYNTQMYPSPVVVESLCQQSMYQQSTYVDRSQMSVTDVLVQKHVSQRSWSMYMPNMPSRGPYYTPTVPYISGHPPQYSPSRYGYSSMPSVHYHASSTASMNAYGRSYMQQYTTSASMRDDYYMPQQPQHYYRPTAQVPHRSQQPATKENSCQTHAIVKRSCDAATQTDETDYVPPVLHQATNTSDSFVYESAGLPVIHQGTYRNSEMELPLQRLNDVIRIAMHGTAVAERLSMSHRKRPCFKKMESVCARIKQDLLRPDAVLPNINSQGVAWAIKDFIFVFIRILNAWVILKGYMYNTPEGLNKIKDELPAGFMAAFDLWQVCTLSLLDMIIKSYVNLDNLLQKQKHRFTAKVYKNNNWSSNENSSDSNSSNKAVNGSDTSPPRYDRRSPSAHSTPYRNGQKTGVGISNEPSLDSTQAIDTRLNYMYTMIQDSEEAQRCVNANGTYLKTGTYTPLKKDDNSPPPPQPPLLPSTASSTTQKISSAWNTNTQSSNPKNPQPQLKAVLNIHDASNMDTLSPQSDVKPSTAPLTVEGYEMASKLYHLRCCILKLDYIDRFFEKQFTRNYYPYFFERCKNQFTDVRAIILKCESATYQHIYQAIHDLRRIVFVVKQDLKDHTNMDLRLYTALYERSVIDMLAKPPFQPNLYEHITGEPGEKLFN